MHIFDSINMLNNNTEQHGIFIFLAPKHTPSFTQIYSKAIPLTAELSNLDNPDSISIIQHNRTDLFEHTRRSYIEYMTATQEEPAKPTDHIGIFLPNLRYNVPHMPRVRAALHMAIRRIHIPINMVCAGTSLDLLDNLIENPNNIANPFDLILLYLKQDMRTLNAHIESHGDPDTVLFTAYTGKKHLHNLLELANRVMSLTGKINTPAAYHAGVADIFAHVLTQYLAEYTSPNTTPEMMSDTLHRCIHAITYTGLPMQLDTNDMQIMANVPLPTT